MYSFIYVFVYLFIYSFMYVCIYLFTYEGWVSFIYDCDASKKYLCKHEYTFNLQIVLCAYICIYWYYCMFMS